LVYISSLHICEPFFCHWGPTQLLSKISFGFGQEEPKEYLPCKDVDSTTALILLLEIDYYLFCLVLVHFLDFFPPELLLGVNLMQNNSRSCKEREFENTLEV
jgi:hypothetical protein